MRSIKIAIILITLLAFATTSIAGGYTMAPDGSYVSGNSYNMAPDGSYVGGNS